MVHALIVEFLPREPVVINLGIGAILSADSLAHYRLRSIRNRIAGHLSLPKIPKALKSLAIYFGRP
jgi:hypothetical protein